MDTIVIGGGCMGASIAFHLVERGERGVVLLERHGLATGNTGKSGSIVRQHYSNPATARMARAALRYFQEWGDRVGGDCGFRRTGLLALAGEADAAGMAASVATQQAVGINTALVSVDEARAIESRLALEGVVAACWEPEAGYADPIATTGLFAARAADRGATIRLGTPATAIRVEGDRVTGVDTPGGFLPAGRVVVATNVWANNLLGPLGCPVPIAPSRHAILALRRPPAFGPAHPAIFSYDQQLYLRPDGDTFTLVGSTAAADAAIPADPDGYHEGLLPTEVQHYKAGAAALLPGLGAAVVRGGWAGVYDVTPDWQGAIGAAPGIAGLYLAVGFSGHGFKLAPIVGEWLAELIISGANPDLAAFDPARFADPAALAATPYGVLG
jgi:sarcosine oxidase subunit beta